MVISPLFNDEHPPRHEERLNPEAVARANETLRTVYLALEGTTLAARRAVGLHGPNYHWSLICEACVGGGCGACAHTGMVPYIPVVETQLNVGGTSLTPEEEATFVAKIRALEAQDAAQASAAADPAA